MKKLIGTFLCILGFAGFIRGQSVSITLDAGLLENTIGTAVVPNGMLLQLIASPSGTFTAPTSSSFTGTGGDNFIVKTFAMNSNGGTPGEVSSTFTISSTTLPAGDALLLRFYPTLASTSASAPIGSTYGQVRSSTKEYTTDPSETPWIAPASGSAVDIYYNTANDSGTYANNTADATNIVLAGIPEPSTHAIIVGLSMSLLSLRAWKRRGVV